MRVDARLQQPQLAALQRRADAQVFHLHLRQLFTHPRILLDLLHLGVDGVDHLVKRVGKHRQLVAGVDLHMLLQGRGAGQPVGKIGQPVDGVRHAPHDLAVKTEADQQCQRQHGQLKRRQHLLYPLHAGL
ncbi:hypothetical protein SDC9_200951 [bioreactor metagenome]|uniref:Uncharacterized protein n=1 Tax=bioreactor metagenome TaxID=1076179 RepID=A0A645IPX6_9ZZZZ